MRVEAQGMAVDNRPAPSEFKGTELAKGNRENNEKKLAKELKQAKEQPSKEVIQEAVAVANHALKLSNRHLQFKLHEGSGRYQVKVLDSDTDEVLRTIPADSILEFSANIRKMLNDAVGFLVDETA